MFDTAGRAVETLAADYALHSAVDPDFDLQAFFRPAIEDTDPTDTVSRQRKRCFRETIVRGQSLPEDRRSAIALDDVIERLVDVANDESVGARQRAAYLDFCDDLFAFAALTVELEERYPSAPVEDALERLRAASDRVIDGDLQEGINDLTAAATELYRTAIVVRRADQLFSALATVGEQNLGRAKATLGGTLDEAIARRDMDRITSVAQQLSSASDGEWTQTDLLDCSHREFEVLVADLWREGGFDARATKYVQDFNIDVIAESDSRRELIQAKQYKPGNKVGVGTVQRTAGLLVEFDADSVAVVTSSSFTANARESVDRMDEQVRLVDGEKLRDLLTKSQLVPSV